jgi:hypothetical protein
MRSNRKLDGARLEVPGCGRTTNAVRVHLARVFGNRLLLLVRTTWKQFADASREPINVLGVERLTPLGGAFSSELPGRGVRQTFLFRPCERRLFHQHTLALVALPRTTEADHHRAQCRISAGASGQGGIPTWQEHKMIQIGTCETQGAFRLQAQKTALAKLVATFGADRASDDPEDHDLARRRDPVATRNARRRGLPTCSRNGFPGCDRLVPITYGLYPRHRRFPLRYRSSRSNVPRPSRRAARASAMRRRNSG